MIRADVWLNQLRAVRHSLKQSGERECLACGSTNLDFQGVAAGGLSPVFLTSVSVVIVVVPLGVLIFTSRLLDDLVASEHPVRPIETRLAIRVAAIMRFIFNTFQ